MKTWPTMGWRGWVECTETHTTITTTTPLLPALCRPCTWLPPLAVRTLHTSMPSPPTPAAAWPPQPGTPLRGTKTPFMGMMSLRRCKKRQKRKRETGLMGRGGSSERFSSSVKIVPGVILCLIYLLGFSLFGNELKPFPSRPS